ncbi:MAG: DUF4349 domain-containing protein [Planctomycetaceae bacterium]
MTSSTSPASRDSEASETQQTAQSLRANRQMIYTAQFTVATADVNETIDRFIDEVDGIGGYLESRNNDHIVVRVPANSFDRVVDSMPSLGKVLSRAIKNEDVTRQHRDLRLRIESLIVARQRLIQLLETATDLEGIIKLEEKLRELTLELETAQGALKGLGEQVAFSRVEVDFRAKTLGAATQQANKRSTFTWINEVGADRLSNGFAGLDTRNTSTRHSLATLWPGAVDLPLPDGFLMIQRQRSELKAVTADDAQLRVRKLVAPKDGSLDFWSTALASHLVDTCGYELVANRAVRNKQNREGRELTFDVVVNGTPMRYLATLFVEECPFWSRTNAIQVIELVAPQDEFQQHVQKFHDGQAWRIVQESPRPDRQMARKSDRSRRTSTRSQSPVR